MIPKFYPGRLPRRLLLLVVLLFIRTASAQPAGIIFTPVPDWVREADWTARTNTPPDDQSEATHYLLVDLQDRPKTAETFNRSVLLMENASGVQDSGKLTFDFNPDYQELELHKVIIHRNGITIDRLDRSKVRLIESEPDLDGDMITGDKKAVIFVEDLRVGDILEYAYTIRGSNPIIGNHYSNQFYLQYGTANDRRSFRVVWEDSRPLNLRSYQTNIKPLIRPFGAGTEYVWSLTNLAAIEDEDLQPASYEPYPYCELSDFPDWAGVVKWALPLYQVTPTNIPPELQELVSSWESGGTTTAEKVRLALDFVQDDVRYTGIELGPDAYRPADPVETFKKRFGDCKGKVNLMCLILQLMNVEAYPALVNADTCEGIAGHLPSPFVFNHVILEVKLGDRFIWLDPTCSHQGGPLENRFVPSYHKALVIRPGNDALEDIPEKPGAVARQNVVSTFMLGDSNTPVNLNVLTEYRGAGADDMRESMADTSLDDMAQNYLNYYTRIYSGIQTNQPLKIHDDRQDNIITVEESYLITNLWKLDDTQNQFEADFHADNLYGILSDPNTRVRKTPLAITHPLIRQQKIIVHLPETGWNIPDLVTNVENDIFSFDYHRHLDGATATYDYAFNTKLDSVPPAAVPKYLDEYDHLQNLLIDTLQRPGGGTSQASGVNWLMVIIGVVSLVVTAVGGGWYWRRTTSQMRPSSVPPPLLSPEEQRLNGLGGWLVLVAIGLFVAPLIRIDTLISAGTAYFSMQVWQTVALPSGASYHPLYGPLLAFELIANILLLGLNLLVIFLFFSKRRAFPRMFILMACSLAIFLVLDDVGTSVLPIKSDPSHTDAIRGLFYAVIWTSYMLKSKRVKATFTR